MIVVTSSTVLFLTFFLLVTALHALSLKRITPSSSAPFPSSHMKIFSTVFLVVCTLALAACVPLYDRSHSVQGTGHTQQMENHNPAMMKGTEPLTIDDVSTNTEIAFRIMNADTPFTDYGILHTKKLHLILVRSDLTQFHHLHPHLGDDGVWRLPLTPDAPGEYWLYADFVDTHEHPYVLRFTKTYPARVGSENAGNALMAKNVQAVSKTVDGYTVEFSHSTFMGGVDLRFDIHDAAQKPVVLQEYLGAHGHAVLLSPEGGYEHAHDISGQYVGGGNDDDPLDFQIASPYASFYRIFVEFQAAGKVHTVDFDWDTTQ